MSWWERLKAIVKREARDVSEGLGNVAGSIDEALARKERELTASPGERIDMLLEEQAGEDARFEELEQRVRGDEASASAGSEVQESTDEPPGPNG